METRKVLLVVFLFLILSVSSVYAIGDELIVQIMGKRFELENTSNYEPTAESFSTGVQGFSMGSFFIKGDIVNSVSKNGVPAYYVGSGNVSLTYRRIPGFEAEDNEGMHIIEDDSTSKVFGIDIKDKVRKGTVIIQTSKDGVIWVTNKVVNNYFSPENSEEFLYETNEIQMRNGCFFRILVAYEKQKEVGTSTILFIFPKTNYKTEKYLELYEFYLSSNEMENSSGTRFELGDAKKVKSAQGYSDYIDIDEGDAQYGWRLGTFFVSGFSSRMLDSDGTIVFLKNVGDKVSLGFELSEDINKLNDNEDLRISFEKKGADKEFQISSTEFGKGALIVQSYDYMNKRSGPIIHSNYLEASARPSVDNIIGLYEEGDYEIALDYSIEDKRSAFLGIASYSHYRIRFNFKVRNGNCMVFPFDVKTGAELTNSSFTENGFRLDLANSRYLVINIEKKILTGNGGNIVIDTRFNKAVPDGSSYTDEGIYTIKVKNSYTGIDTEKVIYVGDNPLIKAHVITGLSLSEINQLLRQGYEIDENGGIVQFPQNQ